MPKTRKLIVEGVKVVKKAVKPSAANENKGGFQNIEMPIDISNVKKVEE